MNYTREYDGIGEETDGCGANQNVQAVRRGDDLNAAQISGTPVAILPVARDFQRRAQFYFDFVEAENSTGFRAPQEAAHILEESIDFSRQSQIALRPRMVGAP